ncbi:MAG: hypothetical protein B6I30_08335 [Desulfobacteraceae bacterium 4572_187]|nr:MAG: hypothetical protein B6I30_08335 [Desulfobacteraceae bacterium 4572_187]
MKIYFPYIVSYLFKTTIYCKNILNSAILVKISVNFLKKDKFKHLQYIQLIVLLIFTDPKKLTLEMKKMDEFA